ncbi:MAG TPA: crotonobetainyl-CoA--carnitine CoA-transferase [Micromonosporaceae bacterium]|nr:crotonobetainyl-CoA--carnitine CoA-transferase [Micromonosporaceae bacterium]
MPLTQEPLGLLAAAQALIDDRARRDELTWRSVAELGALAARPDEGFCREVADHFAAAPAREHGPALDRAYATLKAENLRQFRLALDAGIRVAPWLGTGQPYRGIADLTTRLRASGVLHVYLPRAGHGPGAATPDHPMCEPAGIRVDGVEFTHNDVFRAVHDLFGHVLYGASMGPVGEFRAAHGHMAMYSAAAHPVVFTEQVSQICWFFYGPHLRDASGRLPRRGDPDWTPPAERPYPPQKVFRCPPEFLDRFRDCFQEVPS